LARLSFQNVPTKSGGVVSGNISTGAGSPFGAGGKFAGKVAEIKAEIAKKPVGYYDPPPMTLWKANNPAIESKLEDDPTYQKLKDNLTELQRGWEGTKKCGGNPQECGVGIWRQYMSFQKCLQANRGNSEVCNSHFPILEEMAVTESKLKDMRQRLLAEKNAPIIQAQQEQQAREADLERILEIELAVQRVLDKQVINQRPQKESTAPAITTSPTSYLPLAVVGIVIVVILLFLRRRA